VSLAVIAGVLAVGVGASVVAMRRSADKPEPD
jgi:hypothetical protein